MNNNGSENAQRDEEERHAPASQQSRNIKAVHVCRDVWSGTFGVAGARTSHRSSRGFWRLPVGRRRERAKVSGTLSRGAISWKMGSTRPSANSRCAHVRTEPPPISGTLLPSPYSRSLTPCSHSLLSCLFYSLFASFFCLLFFVFFCFPFFQLFFFLLSSFSLCFYRLAICAIYL
jgi:hypothetical protein